MDVQTSPAPILVLGSGELGAAMLDGLIERLPGTGRRADVTVRPNARTTRRRTMPIKGGMEIKVDIAAASVDELARLFKPYDTILSCIGFAAGSGTQLKLARAALASNVRRYFPWQFGVDYDVIGRGSPQPLFDEQLAVRDMLRGQMAMRWVIVSTGMFTSFLFEPSFGAVDLEGGAVRALGSWDNAVTVTTPEDIGRLTTEIMFDEPEHVDEVIHLAGDTLSYGQLADLVERTLGRPIEREIWTIPALMGALAEAPDDMLRRYRAVFALGRGVSWKQADSFNATRGLTTTGADVWLRHHLASQGT